MDTNDAERHRRAVTWPNAEAADAPLAPPWVDHAVLFYGPRKSGTTLLRSLMDGGSEELLVYPNDIKFKRLDGCSGLDAHRGAAVYFRQWRDQLRGPRGMAGSVKEGTQADWQPLAHPGTHVVLGGLNLDAQTTLLDLSGYISRLRAIEQIPPRSTRDILIADLVALVESITEPPPRIRMWGAKEGGGRPSRVIPFFRSLFPESHIVVIVRNPRHVARSVIRDRHRRNIAVNPIEVMRQVLIAEYEVQEHARLLDDGTIFTLTYEDLVKDTRQVIEQICAFLELEFREIYLTPTTLGQRITVRTASRPVQTVFMEAKRWRDGLRWWEVGLVASTSYGYRVFSTLLRRRYLPYAALRTQVRLRNTVGSDHHP